MPRSMTAVLLLCLALPATGEEELNEYSESILFMDRDNPYDYLNKDDTDEDDQDAHCRELSQQIADLKGKPQRLAAATRRFDAECKTRNGPRERAGLKDSGRLYDRP